MMNFFLKKQMQISWDNVPLSPDKVGHLEILCVKWRKNAALAEHWFLIVVSKHLGHYRSSMMFSIRKDECSDTEGTK